MTRNQRRKAVRARKDAKAEKLNAIALDMLKRETVRHNMRKPIRPHETETLFDWRGQPRTVRVYRSPKGMGNRSCYTGSTGHRGRVAGEGFRNRDVSMTDRELTKYRASVKPKA